MSRDLNLATAARSLLESGGPFTSLYMDTRGDTEDAPQQLELRWRAMREEAAGQGASENALAQLDRVVEGAHTAGDSLVAFTSGDQVELHRHLSGSLADHVGHGPVPHLVPLLDWQQENPPYVVVMSFRTGGEIHIVRGDQPTVEVDVEGDRDPIRRVKAGGWSHRRFQNRAEENWEANAKELVDALARIVAGEDIELVAITGDVRSIQFVEANLPKDVESLSFEMGASIASLEDLEEDLVRNVAAYTARSPQAVLDRFLEERGQDDLAADGIEATIEALQMSQVDTLLLSGRLDGRPAYFSRSDLIQASLDRRTLAELGLEDIEEADVADVVVRSALGTGARVRVIPELSEEHGPRDGVGALLRFAT